MYPLVFSAFLDFELNTLELRAINSSVSVDKQNTELLSLVCLNKDVGY